MKISMKSIKKSLKIICLIATTIMLLLTTVYARSIDYNMINTFSRPVVTFDDGAFTNFDVSGNKTVGSVAGYEIIEEANGNKCVHFNNIAENPALIYNVPTGTITGKMILTFDINVKDADYNNSSQCGRIDLIQASPFTSTTYFRMFKTAEGGLVFNLVDGDGQAWIGNTSYSFNKWYKLKFELNLIKGIYKSSVIDNETNKVVGVVYERKLNAKMINAIYLRTFSNYVSDFMIDNFDLKFERVFAENSLEISEEDDDTLSAFVRVKNDFNDISQSPVLILVVYDENGKLISIKKDDNNGTIPAKSSVILECEGIPVPSGNYKSKAFLWDKTSLEPYCSPISYPQK